jgi:polysaccharide export outer membrane protein
VRQYLGPRLLGAGSALILALLFLADRSPALSRILAGGEVRDARDILLPYLIGMVTQFQPWGTGMGVFACAFRMQEPYELLGPRYVNHAHNDGLQFLIEGGRGLARVRPIGCARSCQHGGLSTTGPFDYSTNHHRACHACPSCHKRGQVIRIIRVASESGGAKQPRFSGVLNNMQIFRIGLIAFGFVWLASCASPGPIGTAPGIELADLSALPPPAVDEAVVIRPRDTLRVSVLGFPELSREFRVDASGGFQFPLLGVVEANGRTPLAISQEIDSRLGSGGYVVDPEVTIDALEQPGRLVTVGGQVKAPGRYPVTGSLSLLEAVAIGGGESTTAQLDEVVILRTVNGQRYIGVYNLAAIQRGNYADPAVYTGDIIQVGDSPSLRRLAAITTLAPLITVPLILIDRLVR